MQHGVSAVIVIPVMIAIFLIAGHATSKAVLWTTLVLVAGATLFFASASANVGDFGPILAVGGFIGAGVITYLVRSRGRKKG